MRTRRNSRRPACFGRHDCVLHGATSLAGPFGGAHPELNPLVRWRLHETESQSIRERRSLSITNIAYRNNYRRHLIDYWSKKMKNYRVSIVTERIDYNRVSIDDKKIVSVISEYKRGSKILIGKNR